MTSYRVLARKYRPMGLATLIGQDVLVQTLRNAFTSGRIAHAFMLTGVRGVGKTTTARIIARALNCIGADGKGSMTLEPCGVCPHCVAIADDRDLDVLEMDAASRTGVDDMRSLLDTAIYKPVAARYKVYIIDEVHMLSKNAFNALLKTLEEPPPHVIFIFATTEIRKVPVTILSRCQRFDLRRVSAQEIQAHLARICKLESVKASDDVLLSLAMASTGSVRDSLSLLDQAIALTNGDISETSVHSMLGHGSIHHVFSLFDSLLQGNVAQSLDLFNTLYDSGTDPELLVDDLAQFCHHLTLLKALPATPDAIVALGLPHDMHVPVLTMVEKLSLPQLTQLWQLLVKGLTDMKVSAFPKQSADMLFIRILYASTLPTLDALVRQFMPLSPAPVSVPSAVASMTPAPIPPVSQPIPEPTPSTPLMPKKRVAIPPSPLAVAPLPDAPAIANTVRASLPDAQFLGVEDDEDS